MIIFQPVSKSFIINGDMKFQVLSECQFEFREKMSSVDALASVIDSIQLYFVKNIKPAGCFLDFQKAFDTESSEASFKARNIRMQRQC